MPKIDFDVVQDRKELATLAKRHREEVCESELYKFAVGILDTALPCIDNAANVSRTTASKKSPKPLPSSLFAPDGWFDGCLENFKDRMGEYKFAWLFRSNPDVPQAIYRICLLSLEEMLRRLTLSYRTVSFVRYFHYFKFMVEIYYKTLLDSDSFRYELIELWADFVRSELLSLSAEMAQAEKGGAVVPAKKSQSSDIPDTDIFSATEKVISEERFSPVIAVRVAELSSFAFQYYCCRLSRIVDAGTDKMYTIFERGSFFRRFVTLFNDSLLACVGSGVYIEQPLITRTFLVVNQVMARVRLYKWNEVVREAIEYSEMARIGYSKFLSLACHCHRPAHIPDAIRCVKNHDQMLDELAKQMRLFEEKNGTKKRNLKSTAKYPSIFDMPDSGVFDWLANEMRSIHKEVMAELKTVTRQNDATKRKLDVIGKDVKVVRDEQTSPSEVDSSAHGPKPAHQPMIDAAIKLLKEWAKKNPAPNSAVAARQVFDEWKTMEKMGKIKRGNRYTNLKAFQGIVARHWKRIPPELRTVIGQTPQPNRSIAPTQ